MPHAWYTYNGTGDINVPGSYALFAPGPGSPSPSCTNGVNLCAIYSLNGGASPTAVTDQVKTYIARALGQGTSQPDSPSNARIFVKMKS